ncbi:MAG: NAD(P)H-hydrate epimerase [Planctomycetes bacterium]|nr:NAD(P)H-hydrate epimerase [Planctomycetota bacterium]
MPLPRRVKQPASIFMRFSGLLDPRLPMRAEARWTGEESAAFDLHLQEKLGIPSQLLMENAGQATARLTLQLLAKEQRPAAPLLILAGPGNNGGDALVCARALVGTTQREVVVWAPCGLPAPSSSAAGLARETARAAGAQIIDSPELPGKLRPAWVLDGLFGVGLCRPIEGAAAAALERIAAFEAPILALDLPSGLDADSGEALGPVPPAAATLSYIGPKQGLECGQGPRCAGEVWIASIGVSHQAAQTWLSRRRGES